MIVMIRFMSGRRGSLAELWNRKMGRNINTGIYLCNTPSCRFLSSFLTTRASNMMHTKNESQLNPPLNLSNKYSHDIISLFQLYKLFVLIPHAPVGIVELKPRLFNIQS